MTQARWIAVLPVGAAALLAAALITWGGVSAGEGAWMLTAVALALIPTGLAAPAGWRRRGAEAALIPALFVFTMVGDPTSRRMLFPVLFLLAAGAAAAAALRSCPPHRHAILVAFLALSLRAAGGPGLSGYHPVLILLALAAPPFLAWSVTRSFGATPGVVAALLAGGYQLQASPRIALSAVAIGLLLACTRFAQSRRGGWAHGWLAGGGAFAAIHLALAAWGEVPPDRVFPGASPVLLVALLCVLPAGSLALRRTPAFMGLFWLAFTLALGPIQPAPVDRGAVSLSPAASTIHLPPATGDDYIVDIALTHASSLPQGTVVGTLSWGDRVLPLRAGLHAVEWAAVRSDVQPRLAHQLPPWTVWRLSGAGKSAVTAAAGRHTPPVPAGVSPLLERNPDLPDSVTLTVTAGPSRPTPPRAWTLPTWLLAVAAVVAGIQLLSRTWSLSGAWLPWAILALGSAAARTAVSPLRLLAERHATDLVLAAFVLAWLPAAARWLRRNRPFPAAAAWLIPLAAATPMLSPPIGDETYHLLLMESLVRDGDLDIRNNFDLEASPNQVIYVDFADRFIHSPALAVLAAPGYLVAGRSGALVLMALAGAALVSLLVRRAAVLGLGRSGRLRLALGLLLTYPLLTFSTQLWVELPGALLAAVGLFLLTVHDASRWKGAGVSLLALVATLLKTRLALVLFPLAAAAWWPARWRTSGARRGVLAVLITAVLALAAAATLVGTPLDPMGRRALAHLIPRDLALAAAVVGGLAADSAGGILFAAPLGLLALAGIPGLWRRGGAGERALVVGGVVTVAALLHSIEWRGGDAPPFRYLVPLLPLFALAAATALQPPRPLRRAAELAVLPSLLVAWVAVTRPHLLVNLGTGGFWLSDALARRFAADGRALFPSFLVAPGAAWCWLAGCVLAAGGALLAARSRPAACRLTSRAMTPLWILAAAATITILSARGDQAVEAEAPQVRTEGAVVLEPPPGAFSRFLHPQGRRMGEGARLAIPVRVPPGTALELVGWAEGEPGSELELATAWKDAPCGELSVVTGAAWALPLPCPAPGGSQILTIELISAPRATLVVDRIQRSRDKPGWGHQ